MSSRHRYISPACCEVMQRHKPIVLLVDDDGINPAWDLRLARSEFDDELLAASLRDRATPPPPTVCPFCGARVPEIVKRAEPPQPLHVYDDGYCLTCKERAHCCECWPPWFAWEAKPSV